MGTVGRLTTFAVREALAFTGAPTTALRLSLQLGEPLRDVIRALHRLLDDGTVAYAGRGRWIWAIGAE